MKKEEADRRRGGKTIYKSGQGWILPSHIGFGVIKLFSCSAQLSMKFSLLINIKMPTTVGIFITYKLRNFHTQLN